MIGIAVSLQSGIDLRVSSSKCLYTSKMFNGINDNVDVGSTPGSNYSTKSEVIEFSEEVKSSNVCGRSDLSPYKMQLEQDVFSLRQRLHEETELHAILEKAAENSLASPADYLSLPNEAQELLSNITTLEAAISSLEQQMVSLQYQISQERNERRLAEYRLKQQPSQLIYSCSSDCEISLGEEDSSKSHNSGVSNKCSTLQALLLALHKLKLSEEQKKFAVDAFEPLVLFALSSGMYSSPAVRIYTAANIREELQEAQRDFIRASVGVSSKGKLLVPKILHCFARSFVDDASLAVWISQFLPSQQAVFVEQCISQRQQSFLGSRNCGSLPFDARFRYIFLPEMLS